MHFCADELFAILAAFPFLSGVFFWMRSRVRVWLKKTNDPCCGSHSPSPPVDPHGREATTRRKISPLGVR